LVFWPSYCYSDSIQPYYGTTPNAAAGGNTWSMNSILPTPPGLDINGVIYNYTINKDVNDHVDVYVGNENANGTGYIFREHDEWKPGSLGGTEIRKVVPVIPNIPRAAWGQGSIEVEGPGSVEDPNVVYMYKVDPCFDPQYDPNCPGYVVPMPPIVDVTIEIYDATQDENVKLTSEELVLIEENEQVLEEKEEEEEEENEKRKREYRLQALADSQNAAMLVAENIRIQTMNQAMQVLVTNSYLQTSIPGGVYKENIQLVDTKINDNKKGLRNGFAQQILHELMISSQYEEKQ